MSLEELLKLFKVKYPESEYHLAYITIFDDGSGGIEAGFAKEEKRLFTFSNVQSLEEHLKEKQ